MGCLRFLVLLALVVAASASKTSKGSVYFDSRTGKYSLKLNTWDTKAAAWGSFTDSLFEVGWGKLYLHTNPKVDDKVQMHAAGYLEGYLTAHRIFDHRNNIFKWETQHYLNRTDFPRPLYDFVEETRQYLIQQVKDHPSEPYWQHVGLMHDQFLGLVEGYAAGTAKGKELSLEKLWMYEASGDLLDLWHAIKPSDAPPVGSDKYLTARSHCSGLVKLVKGNRELFVAQDAWFFLGAMNRILKSYDFPLHHAGARRMTFSSYPGLLFSFDDFYVLDSGLSVIETTFGILNSTLFQRVQSHCVLEWIRVMVANRMAHNGQEWTTTFARENSGSYNNQYVVVDYHKFTMGKAPKPGTLWVLEQIPGDYVAKDMTGTLISQGYFPSINVPQFDKIYETCEYPQHCAQSTHFAFWHDKDRSCRAQMLRRDHGNITDLHKMKEIMRYNNWKKDPLSVDPMYGRDPGAAIMSRYDLRPASVPKALAFGGIDTKVTSAHMAPGLAFHAMAGPTHSKEHGIPVFEFKKLTHWCPRDGVPEKYDFDWQLMHPDDPTEDLVYTILLVVGVTLMLAILTIGVVQYIRHRCSRRSEYVDVEDLPINGGR